MSTVESVTAEVNSQAVVLFVSSHCPYCKKATEELAAHGFSAKVIEANPGQRTILKGMTGVSSVPSCWVKGQYVGGCNDGPESWMGIVAMIKSGKLATMLE